MSEKNIKGIGDWINSAIDVLDITGKLINNFTVEENLNSETQVFPFFPLDLQTIGNSLYLANRSDEDVTLNYNVTTEDGVYSSATQPIKKNSAYECAGDLKYYLNGNVCVCPNRALGGSLGRIISFYAKTVIFGATISLTSGINITFNQNNTYTINTTDPNLKEFKLRLMLKDSIRQTYELFQNIKINQNLDTSEYPLPDGMVFDAEVINEVSGTIEMPTEVYEELVSERMKNLISIEKLGI